MFEFSLLPKSTVGLRASPRTVLAERLLRRVEASRSQSTEFPLRPQLRPVGVRSVNVKGHSLLSSGLKPNQDRPRSFASCQDDPKTRLQGLVPRLKRAASAKVFQRIAERLARLQPQRLRHVSSSPVSLRQSRSMSSACH